MPWIGGGKTCTAMGDCRDGYTCGARGAMMTPPTADAGTVSGPTVCSPVPPPEDTDAG